MRSIVIELLRGSLVMTIVMTRDNENRNRLCQGKEHTCTESVLLMKFEVRRGQTRSDKVSLCLVQHIEQRQEAHT